MKKLLLRYSITAMLAVITTASYSQTNTWNQKMDYGGGARQFAAGFSIGDKGYIGTGTDASGSPFNDFWQYDPATGAWAQMASGGAHMKT